jgi:hypothetical protein
MVLEKEFTMIQKRASQERGYADHGWLQSYHSFSFANYYDPRFMGFGNLRVINEDWVAPAMGFGTHPHRNMEIITYVLSGNLAHKDSMGNASSIPPGDVQRMSAGTGVTHSEFNNEPQGQTHLLQIWIQPDADKMEVQPSYEQITVPAQEKRGGLRLIAAPFDEAAAKGAVGIHADARLYAGLFDSGENCRLPLNGQRKTYVHLARGDLQVNGQSLSAGDALMMQDESVLALGQGEGAEVLVFDLAS